MNLECESKKCRCEEEDNFFHVKILRDGQPMVELDAMGREKFWEDIGRENE
jgi:hypothetical protein